MDADVGDRLVVESNRVGVARKGGTVVEVLGSDRTRHYRVMWEDGQETTFFPSSDTTVEHGAATAAPAATAPPAAAMKTSTQVELRFEEDPDHTEAWATLQTQVGTFTGRGRARRNPIDLSVPLVGEELAAARALVALAEELRGAAGDLIASKATSAAHLV